jgi:hypothetical protein
LVSTTADRQTASPATPATDPPTTIAVNVPPVTTQIHGGRLVSTTADRPTASLATPGTSRPTITAVNVPLVTPPVLGVQLASATADRPTASPATPTTDLPIITAVNAPPATSLIPGVQLASATANRPTASPATQDPPVIGLDNAHNATPPIPGAVFPSRITAFRLTIRTLTAFVQIVTTTNRPVGPAITVMTERKWRKNMPKRIFPISHRDVSTATPTAKTRLKLLIS